MCINVMLWGSVLLELICWLVVNFIVGKCKDDILVVLVEWNDIR